MYSIFRVRRTEEHWQREAGSILFTWGIFNPHGPTLNCVGIRECGQPDQFEIFFRWLHFLGGKSFVLGYLTEDEGDLGSLIEVLRHARDRDPEHPSPMVPLFNCIPSFVTLPETELQKEAMPISEIKELITGSDAFRHADWGREMYRLRKYDNRLFDRAAEEMREAVETVLQEPNLTENRRAFMEMTTIRYGHLPCFMNWKPGQYESRPLSDGDLDEWWTTVTRQDFMTISLLQFAQAWVGASQQAQQAGDMPVVEPFELVKNFLDAHDHRIWPEEFNSGNRTFKATFRPV
ncbi:MAG: hypothetical protein IT368_05900 [Candidatus Hydrogenedentes bacterium]|nr:hypothetical protein [Candidatus Hydrogenedentota bacterium]